MSICAFFSQMLVSSSPFGPNIFVQTLSRNDTPVLMTAFLSLEWGAMYYKQLKTSWRTEFFGKILPVQT